MFDRYHLLLVVPPVLFWLALVPFQHHQSRWPDHTQAATVADLPPDYRVEETTDGRYRWCLPVAKGAQLALCGDPQKSEADAKEDARKFINNEAPKK